MRKRLPLILATLFIAAFGIGFLVNGVNDLSTREVMCRDRVMQPYDVCVTASRKGGGYAQRGYDSQRTHNRWTGFVQVALGYGFIGLVIPLITSIVEQRNPNDVT